jgi:hypothetical protein
MYYLLVPETKNKRYWYYKRGVENTCEINNAFHFGEQDLKNFDMEINRWRWGVIKIEDGGTRTIVQEYSGRHGD